MREAEGGLVPHSISLDPLSSSRLFFFSLSLFPFIMSAKSFTKNSSRSLKRSLKSSVSEDHVATKLPKSSFIDVIGLVESQGSDYHKIHVAVGCGEMSIRFVSKDVGSPEYDISYTTEAKGVRLDFLTTSFVVINKYFVDVAMEDLYRMFDKRPATIDEFQLIFTSDNCAGAENAFFKHFDQAMQHLSHQPHGQKHLKVKHLSVLYNGNQQHLTTMLKHVEPRTLEHLEINVRGNMERMQLDDVMRTDQFKQCGRFRTASRLEEGAIVELSKVPFLIARCKSIRPKEIVEITKRFVEAPDMKVARFEVPRGYEPAPMHDALAACPLERREISGEDLYVFTIAGSKRTVMVHLFDETIVIRTSRF